MEYSYKFKNIENNLEKLLAAFLSNKNFKKYVYYLSDNPLSEADVPDTVDFFTDHIVLTPFDETVLSTERITMFINPIKGNYRRSPLSTINFLVEIIVPIKKWRLPGIVNLRVFRIADEIAKEVDQKRIAGITEVVVEEHSIFKLNKEYSGISIHITIQSSTLKGV